MSEFAGKFKDFPDFIIKITAQIWEGRQIHAIRDYYAENCLLRHPGGIVKSNTEVIQGTLATLSEFPDRRLLGEEVIWCGSDEDGYLSSHRILSTATHLGNGMYGQPTGKKVRYRVIADCWVSKEGQVLEEWLVRDQGAIASYLGMQPRELAEQQIGSGGPGFGYYSPADDKPSRYKPMLDDSELAASYQRLWAQELWGQGNLSAIRGLYHEAATLHGPNGQYWSGHDYIDQFHCGYLASVHDAKFTVDDLTANVHDGGTTVAMRWSVDGHCTGMGTFTGGKQGRRLYIMGISHSRFVEGRIVQEFVLVDEVSTWKQLLG